MRSDFGTVRDICGEAIAAKLVRLFSGSRLYVPKRTSAPLSKSARDLIHLFGGDAADRLSASFGGGWIYIPRDPRGSAGRHAEVREGLAKGESVRAVALRVGYTEHTVLKIRRAARKSRKRKAAAPAKGKR